MFRSRFGGGQPRRVIMLATALDFTKVLTLLSSSFRYGVSIDREETCFFFSLFTHEATSLSSMTPRFSGEAASFGSCAHGTVNGGPCDDMQLTT
jgi:hypothetical protein